MTGCRKPETPGDPTRVGIGKVHVAKRGNVAIAQGELRLDSGILIDVVLWWPVFVFSTTVHEAAHAWAAKLGGDLTAYHGGQVTLDPIPHIKRSPFGMVLAPLASLFLGGFMIGWASTPYDINWARRYPHRSAWMALAGPMGNLALIILCFIIIRVGIATGLFNFDGNASITNALVSPGNEILNTVGSLVAICYSLNVILMILNLIPVPPLDGASAIMLLFPARMAPAIQEKMAFVGMFGIFIAWVILDKIAGPALGIFWTLAII